MRAAEPPGCPSKQLLKTFRLQTETDKNRREGALLSIHRAEWTDALWMEVTAELAVDNAREGFVNKC